MKLSKNMLNQMIYVLLIVGTLCVLNDYGCSLTSVDDVCNTRRPLGKITLKNLNPERSLRKYSSNWTLAKKI